MIIDNSIVIDAKDNDITDGKGYDLTSNAASVLLQLVSGTDTTCNISVKGWLTRKENGLDKEDAHKGYTGDNNTLNLVYDEKGSTKITNAMSSSNIIYSASVAGLSYIYIDIKSMPKGTTLYITITD